MAKRRNGAGGSGCGILFLPFFLLFFALPLVMLLAAPAIAARIETSGVPSFQPHLREWLWASLATPPIALVLVRMVLSAEGRYRDRSRNRVKRWLSVLAWSLVVLGAVNVDAFLELTSAGHTDHVISGGVGLFAVPAGLGIAALVAAALADRRPIPPTIEEVRAAVAETDRALRRVRAENERVHRQAAQVRQRLAKLRAQSSGGGAERPGRARAAHADRRRPVSPDVEFRALKLFHRESYQCADTAFMAYESTQVSLRSLSSVARGARIGARRWVPKGRAGRQVRAEMRDLADYLTRAQGELRVEVDKGLGRVRSFNADTAGLKHEIRDNCGQAGWQWFEALEERIAEAKAERRASRAG
ncbi:MAG: hypothetical protein HOV87_10405 [Catenulispora sp.]|nr:hypothetical protein [Catenulispora sp.]